MTASKTIPHLLVTLLAATLPACSEAPQETTPYAPGDATVIGVEQGGQAMTLDEACSEHECNEEVDACGDRAAADVILDENGEVVDVICYKQDVDVETLPIDEIESATAGNNTVLVLDDVADGADVIGDVTLEGNNVVVWGHGPDVSEIGGTVDIEKNNAVVRGVRIGGDMIISKNNAQLAFCEIEGNLTITGNNTTLAECTVHGSVTIEGVNTVLVQNRFTQAEIAAKNLICNDNVLLTDADAGVDADAGAASPAAVECVNTLSAR